MTATGTAATVSPMVLLSVAVSLLTLIEVAIRVGKWASSVELRLARHSTDLKHVGLAVAAHHICPDPAAHTTPAHPSAGTPAQPDGGQ